MLVGILLLGEKCLALGGKTVPFLTVKQKVLIFHGVAAQGLCPRHLTVCLQ